MAQATTTDSIAIDVSRIAGELGLSVDQVAATIALLDEGNTVPFITRYRKERTGNLDEVEIRAIQERATSLRQLAEKAQNILRLIEAQGALTPELRNAIQQADTLKRLDDLYLPFRPKRQSRASLAKSRGLEPLAERIWKNDASLVDLNAAAEEHISPEKELATRDDVLQGVCDILAERVSENADVRATSRKIAWQTGVLEVAATEAGEQTGQDYRNYFGYAEGVSKIPHHRALALNRGEKAGALRVKLKWDAAEAERRVTELLGMQNHRFRDLVAGCVTDALSRLVLPSLERELRRELTDRAEAHAVRVFARNLKHLLLQPPLAGKRVLAIDPGFRTGCKLAALDECGNCLATDVIYVTGNDEKKAASRQKLAELMRQHDCSSIAIGNGTACRECEEIVTELIANEMPDAQYTIVNEAGASIYSTSTVAREEFPDLDATARGTISIGRRLQDPLSELVKIEPQHIGVGMYQHDLSAKELKESLDQVVESCVNFVGVDLNTASASLLRHVSGFNQLIARRVVEWRQQHGRFNNRNQLLEVAGIGQATFTQAAGFLKVMGGDQPLDGTWIHPESYEIAQRLLARISDSPDDANVPLAGAAEIQERLSNVDLDSLAKELQVGRPTFDDILDALSRPGRDPRSDGSNGPLFKRGILKLDDLTEGMELTGTVLNVVDFGAFVDIGLKDSGLVHVSQMSERFIQSPHDVATVGDVVTVWVLGIDAERRRVSLTMRNPAAKREKPAQKAPAKSPPPAPAPTKPPEQKKTHVPRPAEKSPPKPHSQPKREKTKGPSKLTAEKRSGAQPLSGFDELKELWKERKQ